MRPAQWRARWRSPAPARCPASHKPPDGPAIPERGERHARDAVSLTYPGAHLIWSLSCRTRSKDRRGFVSVKWRETGVRNDSGAMASVTCRRHVANDAKITTDALPHCPILPDRVPGLFWRRAKAKVTEKDDAFAPQAIVGQKVRRRRFKPLEIRCRKGTFWLKNPCLVFPFPCPLVAGVSGMDLRLLYVQYLAHMTIIKTSTSHFACASPATTPASLSSISFQPST